MIYDGQGLKGISVAGSESPSYMGLIPYNVTYTNANSISITRGGTMYLGAAYYSNKLTAYPFECGYFKTLKFTKVAEMQVILVIILLHLVVVLLSQVD